MTGEILTVGHSNHPEAKFIDLLRTHDVSAVADVRSTPFSRFSPQFSKDALREALREAGVGYVFLGRELGARSSDPSCYVDGQVRYPLLAQTQLFRQGIDRLLRGAQEERIAVMCSEKEPLDCHRTVLVAAALVEAGVAVRHILADGRVETHGEAMDRLLEMHRLHNPELTRSRQERLQEALERQERQIAYTDPDLAQPAAAEAPA